MAFSPKRNMTAIGLADSSHVRVTGNAFTGAVKVVSMDAACQDVVAQPS